MCTPLWSWNLGLHSAGGIPQFCGVNAVKLELHNVFYKHVRTFINVQVNENSSNYKVGI